MENWKHLVAFELTSCLICIVSSNIYRAACKGIPPMLMVVHKTTVPAQLSNISPLLITMISVDAFRCKFLILFNTRLRYKINIQNKLGVLSSLGPTAYRPCADKPPYRTLYFCCCKNNHCAISKPISFVVGGMKYHRIPIVISFLIITMTSSKSVLRTEIQLTR